MSTKGSGEGVGAAFSGACCSVKVFSIRLVSFRISVILAASILLPLEVAALDGTGAGCPAVGAAAGAFVDGVPEVAVDEEDVVMAAAAAFEGAGGGPLVGEPAWSFVAQSLALCCLLPQSRQRSALLRPCQE